MGVTWITPVEITPSTANAWIDVDVSPYVVSGTTGVILRVVHLNAAFDYLFGCRKNGSTDNRLRKIEAISHCTAFCGVDYSRLLELYVGSTAYIDVYLIGYFDLCAVFNTNAVNKSLSTTSSWLDIDLDVNDGAVGTIIEVYNNGSSTNYSCGLRKNGSTDNRTNTIIYGCHGVIGVDSSEILEGYISNTNIDFYVMGYLKSGVTFNTNATHLSLSTTGSYQDLSTLSSGATGGFFEVISSTAGYSYALRKNGSSEDIYYDVCSKHNFYSAECDSSRLIEGKIESTSVDFYLIGYARDEPKGNQLFFGMNF